MSIEFHDYSVEVKQALNQNIIAFLYEAAGEIESQVKRNTPVDTSQLKLSWYYKVDENKKEATIGSPLENAIWTEFGTGQYALHGDGRKTPWRYKDVKGQWHTTKGKKPLRCFHNAFEYVKPKLEKIFEQKVKDGEL